MAKRKKVITEEMVNSTRAIRAVVAIKDSLLPDDIKVRAIKDIIYTIDDHDMLLEPAPGKLEIKRCFFWNLSKEGAGFWFKVNEIVGTF